jgi:hypothetical protein
MSAEAFSAAMMSGESYTLRITSSGTTTPYRLTIRGDVWLSVRANAVYVRWGKADTTVTDGTAATQGMYIPAGAVLRVHIPDDATHIIVLQDTGAGYLYLTPGSGI